MRHFWRQSSVSVDLDHVRQPSHPEVSSRSGTRPAHGHQMHELGSTNVMRLDRTPVASRCLRIKLYFDENFP